MNRDDLDINTLSEQELSTLIAEGRVSVSDRLTWVDVLKECDRFFRALGHTAGGGVSLKSDQLHGLRQSATQIYIDAQTVIGNIRGVTAPGVQNG